MQVNLNVTKVYVTMWFVNKSSDDSKDVTNDIVCASTVISLSNYS